MSETIDGGPAFPTDSERQVGPDTWHYEGMPLRTYAAINLRVPDSGIEWLDDMIRQARRDEFAGMALQGIAAYERGQGFPWPDTAPETLRGAAELAWQLADAMMAAKEAR